MDTQPPGEISAILGVAYESFLKARLERRAGRRGKVHARTAKNLIKYVGEMIGEGTDGHDANAVFQVAIAELDRGEIEADVLEHHGYVVPEHEWPVFLAWLEPLKLARGT